MAKINNNEELAKFLYKQSLACEDYAGVFAKELTTLATLFREIEPFEIKDLKKLPKLLLKAAEKEEKAKQKVEEEKKKLVLEKEKNKEQVEKLKEQLSKEKERNKELLDKEKEKNKEQAEKFKEQLSKEKEKNKDQLDQEKEKNKELILRHKEEILALKANKKQEGKATKSTRKTKVNKNLDVETINAKSLEVSQEVQDIRVKLRQFFERGQDITKTFDEKGEVTIYNLQLLANEYVEKMEDIEIKVAFKLYHVMIHASLQFLEDGSLWRKHGFVHYNVYEEASKVLYHQYLTESQLKLVASFFDVGVEFCINAAEIQEKLIEEIALRADIR